MIPGCGASPSRPSSASPCSGAPVTSARPPARRARRRPDRAPRRAAAHTVPDHPGELARLTSFVSHRDLNVHSILTYPDSPDSVRTVLRIGSIETRLLAEDLRRAGFEVLWPPEKPCPR